MYALKFQICQKNRHVFSLVPPQPDAVSFHSLQRLGLFFGFDQEGQVAFNLHSEGKI